MEHFDRSKHLHADSAFRNSLRLAHGMSSDQMNRAGSLLDAALEKHAAEHPGEHELTEKNFDKVMEHMRKDPGYHRLYSGGSKFEAALRNSLKMPPANE
jgi:hypothetical protein